MSVRVKARDLDTNLLTLMILNREVNTYRGSS